jgi:hypothetical protein
VDDFLAERTYRVFEPGDRPEVAWKEWQRAVRAVLEWARDDGG